MGADQKYGVQLRLAALKQNITPDMLSRTTKPILRFAHASGDVSKIWTHAADGSQAQPPAIRPA